MRCLCRWLLPLLVMLPLAASAGPRIIGVGIEPAPAKGKGKGKKKAKAAAKAELVLVHGTSESVKKLADEASEKLKGAGYVLGADLERITDKKVAAAALHFDVLKSGEHCFLNLKVVALPDDKPEWKWSTRESTLACGDQLKTALEDLIKNRPPAHPTPQAAAPAAPEPAPASAPATPPAAEPAPAPAAEPAPASPASP